MGDMSASNSQSASRLNLPVLLINLDRSPDRLLNMVEQFEKYGISFIRIQAVDGLNVLMNEINYKISGPASHNLPGAIGAVLSHLKCIRIAHNLGYERVMIMEDDIDISFVRKCRAGLSYDEICDNAPLDWEILQMHTSNPTLVRQVYWLSGINSNKYILRDDRAWSSGGYIINRKGIEKIMQKHFDDDNASFVLYHPRGKLAPDRIIYNGATTYLYSTPTISTFDGLFESTITPSKLDEGGVYCNRHIKLYYFIQKIRRFLGCAHRA